MKSNPFLDYKVPVLKKNNSYGEFIEYQILDSETQKFVRYRIRLSRYRQQLTVKQYHFYVNHIIAKLCVKLANGWTPQNGELNDRIFTPIDKVFQAYINDRQKELRPMTIVSYTSICKILQKWLQEHGLETMEVRLFNHTMAIQFMESLLTHEKFNNNSYNTYLQKYATCFNWMKEHEYCTVNPFENIKARQKEDKIRCLIPQEIREKILRYVRTSGNPNFEIVMHLIFSSLIRPTEITRIQIQDIDLLNKCIHIPARKSKTHHPRLAALTDACIWLLVKLLAPGYPNDWYLLGKDLVPSKEQTWNARYKKEWMKIRKACNLPADMQLYSLKDSGITEMLEAGVSINAVKDAAGHTDISTTNKYVGKNNEKMIEAVRGAGVSLGKKNVKN